MRLFVVIGLRGYGDPARFYVNSPKMWVVKNTIESCTFVRIFVIVCIFLTLHSRNTLSPLYPRQRCNALHGNFTRLRLSTLSLGTGRSVVRFSLVFRALLFSACAFESSRRAAWHAKTRLQQESRFYFDTSGEDAF